MTIEDDAREVFEKLKKFEGFPDMYCLAAARELKKKGYPIIIGKIKVDEYCWSMTEEKLRHAWNYDPITGNYIDITGFQFNKYMSASKKLPEVLIIHPESKLAKEIYLEEKRDVEDIPYLL